MDEEKYEGLLGKTRIGTTIYTCPCGTRFGTKIFLTINTAERPELVEHATGGNINIAACPSCQKQSEIPVRYIYHDPDNQRFVLVLPEIHRHEELTARAQLMKEIAETPTEVIPDYVINFSCVFGSNGLMAYVASPAGPGGISNEEAQELRRIEADTREKEGILAKKEGELQEVEAALAEKEQSITSREGKLRERGEEVTEMEDLAREKGEELESKEEELKIFVSRLKEWEAQLGERQTSLEKFASMLEETRKSTDVKKPHIKEVDAQPEKPPSWFASKGEPQSPSLSSSIQDILPQEKKVEKVAHRDVIDESDIISESDVISESDIMEEAAATQETGLIDEADIIDEAEVVEESNVIDEADIIDEKPVVPIPLKESKPEKKTIVEDEKVARELLKRGWSVDIKDDRVSLWTVAPEKLLKKEVDPAWARLRCHVMKDDRKFPWIIISLTLRPPKAETLFFKWLFNLKDPEQYRKMKFLEKNFEADITLVPKELDKLTTISVQSPLAGNLKTIIENVEKITSEDETLTPDKELNEDALMENLLSEFKKPFPFHSKYFADEASPGQTMDAVMELEAWSKPPLSERVIYIYSYPLDKWSGLKKKVVKTAISLGIFIPDSLWKEATAFGLVSNKRESLADQIKAFTQLCIEGADLDFKVIKVNWENLLEEARNISLPVNPDDAIIALNFIDESNISKKLLKQINKKLDIKIQDADKDTLRRLLAIKKKRADALLEIIERDEKDLFDNIKKAVMEMDAEELNRVLPTINETEDLGEMIFLEGLASKMRAVRITSAAYSARHKLRSAIVPLVKVMFDSTEPDWKFVAWLLTKYGISGMRAIEQFVRDPRGQDDKIIYLLAAFICAGQEKRVDKFSSDTNLIVKSIVTKAKGSAGEVIDDEDKIRNKVAKELGIDLP